MTTRRGRKATQPATTFSLRRMTDERTQNGEKKARAQTRSPALQLVGSVRSGMLAGLLLSGKRASDTAGSPPQQPEHTDARTCALPTEPVSAPCRDLGRRRWVVGVASANVWGSLAAAEATAPTKKGAHCLAALAFPPFSHWALQPGLWADFRGCPVFFFSPHNNGLVLRSAPRPIAASRWPSPRRPPALETKKQQKRNKQLGRPPQYSHSSSIRYFWS